MLFEYLYAMDTPKSPKHFAEEYINKTDRNIFLTGRAGTGKTTFLREIKETSYKNTVIAAPTGIAAINAGGVTLHSLFHLPFGSYIPENTDFFTSQDANVYNPKSLISRLKMHSSKRKLLNELELLVIDEVSMLRADLLDAIDEILRHVRRNRSIPFGGVQVLFIGDLLQLPPVVKDHELNTLKNYYDSMFFFNSKVIEKNPLVYVELDKVYRQTDDEFISLLNKLRNNELDEDSLNTLNKYYQPDLYFDEEDGQVFITTHNYKADKKNEIELRKIENEPVEFQAEVEGEISEYHYPHNQTLTLKEGAQVMFIKNDPTGEQRYFNGKIGYVNYIDSESITVKCDDGTYVDVEPYTWENKKFKLNSDTDQIEEETIGVFKQYPLRLAWAITVHKSQGLTFEKAILDLSDTFSAGQVYVALSRLTSLKGLTLASPLPLSEFQTDEQIIKFSNTKKEIVEMTSDLSFSQKRYVLNLFSRVFAMNSLQIAGRVLMKGYNSEERTLRSKYKLTGVQIVDTIENLVSVGNKFTNQIKSILSSKTSEYLKVLEERTNKSVEYFIPFLDHTHKDTEEHIKEIKANKKLKSYKKDLESIKDDALNTKRNILKLQTIIRSFASGRAPAKDEIRDIAVHNQKQKPVKEKKKPTKEVTFEMYKEGKTVEEIAELRGFVPGTIAGHLVNYIKDGEIDVLEFLSKEKLENIIKVKSTTKAEKFTEIKQYLGEEYTYEDIRFALAYMENKELLPEND